MRCRFRVSWFLILFVALFCSLLWAQDAVVKKNVNLRRDPSTAQPPIRLLKPLDELDFVEPNPTNGYYHVRTSEGEEGWVWGNNIRLLGAPVEPTAPSDTISETWSKPQANQTTFTSEGKTCGPTGDGGDAGTNLRKNRKDTPSSYHDVTISGIATLPYPSPAPKHRQNWSAQQLAEIERYEGVAVRVVGYIVALKPQTGGSGESTNCHWTKSAQVDWHIALTASPGEGERDSIVVETTPRVRENHPMWTVSRLRPWEHSTDPVRVSGWLMFDPEHRNHLGKYRVTLWEIHPITKIEVYVNGEWVDLDNLP